MNILDGLRVIEFSANLNFGLNYSFNIFMLSCFKYPDSSLFHSFDWPEKLENNLNNRAIVM